MNTQAVRTQVSNNIMVAMSTYVNQDIMSVLERVIGEEFQKINMDVITTLPVERKDDINQRNQYLIQLFMVKKRGLAKGTMNEYLRAVKCLMLEINNKSLDQMDENDIDWYLAQYERRNSFSDGKKKEATTVNNERRFLSAFFTWMRKAKFISENPVECIPAKKVIAKPIDYYSAEEMARIRDACVTPRERAIVEVFRSTGARVGEIADIKLMQVNFDTGDILIQGEKGGRYRTIYLDEDARYYYKLYLDTRCDNCPFLFTQARSPYGKMTTCAYRSIFKAIADRAGLKCRVYPHKFRKSLGMNLKNHGVDIGTIQEVLGHASPVVTSQFYAQSTPHTLRSIRERVAV